MGPKPDTMTLDAGVAAPGDETTSVPPFREIFDTHAPYVFRTLLRLGVRHADAGDMCQEVFLVVHRRLRDFDGTSALRTWIYGITLRVASQYRRGAGRRREDLAESVPEPAVEPPQESRTERRLLLDRLERALDRLDANKREVFVLYELEELTMNDVARAVGCPLQTAYSRLHAARAIVRDAFLAEDREKRG